VAVNRQKRQVNPWRQRLPTLFLGLLVIGFGGGGLYWGIINLRANDGSIATATPTLPASLSGTTVVATLIPTEAPTLPITSSVVTTIATNLALTDTAIAATPIITNAQTASSSVAVQPTVVFTETATAIVTDIPTATFTPTLSLVTSTDTHMPQPMPVLSPTVAQPTATLTETPQTTATATPTQKLACQVIGGFSTIWHTNQERLGCETSDVITSPITYEPFENGYLVWSKFSDFIYVLPKGANWSQHTNSWVPNDNRLPCSQAQQFGYPAMGFGKLWCANERVRIALGDPIGEELPNEFAQQQMFEGGFFFEVFGGQTIILFEDGTWSMN